MTTNKTLSLQMHITITDLLSPEPIPMGNIQIPGYRIRFVSNLVAGHAIFVPAYSPPLQLPGQQFVVETGCEYVENVELWTGHNRPAPMIKPLVPLGDYELVATVHMVEPLTDAINRIAVDVVIGEVAFAFSAQELGPIEPRSGDIISCTLRTLSLWDEAI
jgi:hypothetical protein